jgi:hypothetical protein
MSGTIPPLPQYAFMEWYSVKVQEQLYLLPYFLKLTARAVGSQTLLFGERSSESVSNAMK